jgi:hypothetical protein
MNGPPSLRRLPPTKRKKAAEGTDAGGAQRVMRKANGEVSAQDGAGLSGILQRAANSSSSALPDGLRDRFEASTGQDLGGVKVHTGPDSAAAAQAVNARAFAHGQSIHFDSGEYAPGSASGDRLIAHEVFHTLQSPQAASGDGIEVSSAGDAAEVEADRGADAMVAGEQAPDAGGAAPGVIHREERPNSYAEGKGIDRTDRSWADGTALDTREWDQFQEKCSGVASKAQALATIAGISIPGRSSSVVESLLKNTKSKFAVGVELREAKVAYLKSKIDHLEGITQGIGLTVIEEIRIRLVQQELDVEQADLDAYEGQYVKAWFKTIKDAAAITGKIDEFFNGGDDVVAKLSAAAGELMPEKFTSLTDAFAKIDKASQIVNLGAELMDRSALDTFMSDPNFETAAMWGEKVGAVFASASGLAAGLPPPWADVVEGSMQMPAAVIGQFTGLMRDHIARIDEMTTDVHHGKSELLAPGTSQE